jgi:deoxyribodipyrimidine photo-lyase
VTAAGTVPGRDVVPARPTGAAGSSVRSGAVDLPLPVPGDEAAWVGRHLGHLTADGPRPSARFRGTQAAADAALASFDVTGYAARRNEVLPVGRRGASGLSPWIRHGLLPLPRVWDEVDGPGADVRKFRDELRWQEYARHVYARLGTATARPLRFEPATSTPGSDPWDRSMRCVDACLEELEADGWLVNQTRMWLASQWTVRHGADWRDGEDRFFTHLLDGSRAANRLGWQWTVGAGTGRPYGFSQWQVRKRAPSLCRSCVHRDACPIGDWPDEAPLRRLDADDRIRHDPDVAATAGPAEPWTDGAPELVWLTAESLGDDDPALAAHPGLPVVFVFDEPLLARLRLSGKRLVFLAERLAELGAERTLVVRLGDPVTLLGNRPLASTFTPVPGWRRAAARLPIAAVHPWPWLHRPVAGGIGSYSSWVKQVTRRAAR